MEENERLYRYVYDEREVITEESGQEVVRYIRGYELISSDSEKARTYTTTYSMNWEVSPMW